jgi:ankyrin repeat protein
MGDSSMQAWTVPVRSLSAARLRLSMLAVGAAMAVIVPVTAKAQLLNSSMPPHGSPMKRQAPEKPVVPDPDAVPGDRARTPAAPATHAAGDLQPTDALFDAINRGDIAAARDSLNRGADLNGVNVLGMTPMELSVDLGRNDISFLLLSMRGEDSGRGSRLVTRDNGAPAKPAVPAKSVADKRSNGRNHMAEAPVAPRAIASPKLFANDGGTPQPAVGFLGFDSRSAAN